MRIRLAARDDLPRIVEIYNASIPGRRSTADLVPVSVADRESWFAEHEQPHRPLWVAERGDAVIGWLSLSDYHPRAAYRATAEVGVYVAPEAQRAGVGDALLRHAIAAAPAAGVRTLVWVTFAANPGSVRLATGAGFTRWGLLPRVTELDGERLDVEILGLELS